MKNLELVERKNTTESAKKSVIKFFESIDLSAAADVSEALSDCFYCHSKWSSGEFESVQFINDSGKLRFVCGGKNNLEKATYVFDDACDFINFKAMMTVFEKFMNKLNELIKAKEEDISLFLEYCEEWKSYQETLKQAKDHESKTETI